MSCHKWSHKFQYYSHWGWCIRQLFELFQCQLIVWGLTHCARLAQPALEQTGFLSHKQVTQCTSGNGYQSISFVHLGYDHGLKQSKRSIKTWWPLDEYLFFLSLNLSPRCEVFQWYEQNTQNYQEIGQALGYWWSALGWRPWRESLDQRKFGAHAGLFNDLLIQVTVPVDVVDSQLGEEGLYNLLCFNQKKIQFW